MKHYKLYIKLIRDGRVRDEGLHDARDFSSDEEAIATFQRELRENTVLASYDKVTYQIMEGERLVSTGFDIYARVLHTIRGR